MENTIRSANPTAVGAATGRQAAPARVLAPEQAQRVARDTAATSGQRGLAPFRRRVAGADSGLQDEVARAQQAVEYLDRVASQLDAIKAELAAKLSGSRGDEQALQQRLRELAATLAQRRKGGGVDARLDFNGKPATQRFRIRGLDMSALQAAPQTLTLSVASAGAAQLTVSLEPGLSRKEIAQRFDRALAPLQIHANLDDNGQLVFSTDEANWAQVKDNITVSGRGRVTTDEEPPQPDLQNVDTGNVDNLRQSLREVVQALARVRRSQEAASAALRDATTRAAQATAAANAADAQKQASDFATTASNPDYDSLLALTSALVGVSRERVLALLGLR
jgi:hypothetical protein